MPRRDGTGPEGKGPGTGRGMGACNDKKASGNQDLGKRGGRRRCGRYCRWDENNNSDTTKN